MPSTTAYLHGTTNPDAPSPKSSTCSTARRSWPKSEPRAVSEGTKFVGEVGPVPSLAVCQLDVTIAWADVEDALAHHEPFAATAAVFDWHHAMKRLEAAR